MAEEVRPQINAEAMNLLVERYDDTSLVTDIWNRIVRETYSYDLAYAVVAEIELRRGTRESLTLK